MRRIRHNSATWQPRLSAHIYSGGRSGPKWQYNLNATPRRYGRASRRPPARRLAWARTRRRECTYGRSFRCVVTALHSVVQRALALSIRMPRRAPLCAALRCMPRSDAFHSHVAPHTIVRRTLALSIRMLRHTPLCAALRCATRTSACHSHAAPRTAPRGLTPTIGLSAGRVNHAVRRFTAPR